MRIGYGIPSISLSMEFDMVTGLKLYGRGLKPQGWVEDC